MRKLVLLISMLAVSAYAQTQPDPAVLDIDTERLIHVQGPIGKNAYNTAMAIYQMSQSSLAPIYLQINSPGGAVFSGGTIVSAIQAAQARGVSVHCFVTSMAASMAFTVLDACDNRYAFSEAKLLFHPVRASGIIMPMTQEVAETIVRAFADLNGQLRARLIDSMQMDSTLFDTAFRDEHWWTPQNLMRHIRAGWIKVIAGVNGAQIPFLSPGIPTDSAGNVIEAKDNEITDDRDGGVE